MGLFFPVSLVVEEGRNVRPQDISHKDQAGKEAEAEPSHSPVDQDEDWQHHPVQCQEETLEEDQAEVVNHPFYKCQRFNKENTRMEWISADFFGLYQRLPSFDNYTVLCVI